MLCDVVGCGDGGGTAGARTGNYWAWMGGTSNPETSWIEQTVTVPNSPERHLNFWMWMGSVESSSQLEVKVDGNVVASYPTVLESGYVQRSVDLSDYADGGSHTIRFELVLPGDGNVNVSLDDITLECEAP